MEGEIITKEKHPEIYKWLDENVYYNYQKYQKYFTLTNDKKINVYYNVSLSFSIAEIKYPFGVVCHDFNCSYCEKLKSFKNAPKEIGGYFSISGCKSLTSLIGLPKKIKRDVYLAENNFSNNTSDKKYKHYITMWFELLESVSDDERWEYINNYKDKYDSYYNLPIIPKEVMNKYKIDFLLNEK